MPFNVPSETVPGNGTSTASGKRKAKGKSATSSSGTLRSAARRSAAEPVEIIFKDQPNPHQTPQPPYILIDHPQQNERLRGSVYVVRLGVGGAETVEISIDGEPWRPCRLTSGYWWFDWSGIRLGKHTLTARMRTFDGRIFRTPTRTCDYRP